ncbi:uroporphyrinogen-III C-methyltransferase [Bacillota bacterium LX-D]|nr:uroporphyrinogen-III C-methyltransferase [Bacillota bacterium LX-D]
MANKGYVYLVGAGPGDPGLLTIKGQQCIQKADVVVYDRLVGKKLLGYVRSDAELIYVGKSPERHTLRQEEINELLLKKALEGKIVTRLKGGDPFVFGRGGEEAEILQENGVQFEIVPGITSAIAVPAYAGIPVTHRNCTSTIGIVTGNEDPTKEDSSISWDKIATGMGTLVFLMGMANLPKIVHKLVTNGRSADTPVALIRWGTRPEQETLVGTLSDIVAKAEKVGFKNPAIIIVGEVVTLRDKLQWFEQKPLFGKRIVVTRSREQASALTNCLEQLGAEVVEFPTIEITPPADYSLLDQELENIASYKWIIFTSANGVRAFFKRLRDLKMDIRSLYGINICAIGPKTSEALENYGLCVEYVPEEFVAEAVIAGLQDKITEGDKVLLPRADIARKVLPEALKKIGAEITEVAVYRTVRSENNLPMLLELFENNQIDIITFTSSSTVRNFIETLPQGQKLDLLNKPKIACIGPITAQTAKDFGLDVHIVASEYTIEGLVQALVKSK